MYKVGVLGAGTWGMAVARVLCNRHHSVMVWSALPQEIEYIQKNRTHPKLPELQIPDDMEFTTDILLNKDNLKQILQTDKYDPFLKDKARGIALSTYNNNIFISIFLNTI